jgi:hydrogenase maturation protein HypF
MSSSTALSADPGKTSRCMIAIDGLVQGVGFRPFVYRLALAHGLGGSVRNGLGGVLIEVEGDRDAVTHFLDQLGSSGPPVARPASMAVTWLRPRGDAAACFTIDESARDGRGMLFPAADLAVCAECLAELHDPADRRHAYPLLNCTACGPRFTIMRALPYDRERTSMARFTLCQACRAEYEDPADRRFHAKPTACLECGPRLAFLDRQGRRLAVDDPLASAVAALGSGRIVVMKGLGGFHVACDATNASAVAELRRRKARDAKPLAVMVKSLDEARRLCGLSDVEGELLSSSARPIVLLEKRAGGGDGRVAADIAPGLRHLGLMLPYTPLHHRLLEGVGVPLVMTSGNVSDEPIAYDDADAVSRLAGLADCFLVHDRPIQVRCDDSVARVVRGAPLLLRRARGYVPLPIALPCEARRPILACGDELKSVFGLVRGDQTFLSEHLGDLSDERSGRAWLEALGHLERLLDLSPAVIVHDLHPGYRTTAYAKSREGVERLAVQHHHAHIASCLAYNGVDVRVIGIAWDGTGYGIDGHVWGGEFLVADLAGFERVGHLEEVPMPGSEAAIREPWRMAAAYLACAYGAATDGLDLEFVRRLDRSALRVLSRAAARGLNAPLTSSAGRLFDGIASLLGVRDTVAFEGQAAMEMEALAEPECDHVYRVAIAENAGRLVVKTSDLVRAVVEDLLAEVKPARLAARLDATLADVIVRACRMIREQTGLGRVVLSGGVFQNMVLLGAAADRLEQAGFEVYTHHQVPPNDGGLALGQAAVAARLQTGRGSG